MILPIVIFTVIILICKWSNFSMIPKDMKMKTPESFKMPKIRRGINYTWYSEESEDSSVSEDNSSESDSSDEELSEDEMNEFNVMKNQYEPEFKRLYDSGTESETDSGTESETDSGTESETDSETDSEIESVYFT